MEAIRKLQLEVTLDAIARAILSAPKLKLKHGDVRILKKSHKIRVYAEATEQEPSQHARLMTLARALPGIVVKVGHSPLELLRMHLIYTYRVWRPALERSSRRK